MTIICQELCTKTIIYHKIFGQMQVYPCFWDPDSLLTQHSTFIKRLAIEETQFQVFPT